MYVNKAGNLKLCPSLSKIMLLLLSYEHYIHEILFKNAAAPWGLEQMPMLQERVYMIYSD